MDQTLMILVGAAFVIAVILFLIMKFMPNSSGLNKEKYQSKWMEIERQAKASSLDSRSMSILKADKLLDQALKETGAKGETMGQRMKSRQGVWTSPNSVWAAHKLRNQIAHEDHVNLNEDIVRRALASFKKALIDLGAL